jgi:hypothetical protein
MYNAIGASGSHHDQFSGPSRNAAASVEDQEKNEAPLEEADAQFRLSNSSPQVLFST